MSVGSYAFESKQRDYRSPLWTKVDAYSTRHRKCRRVLYLDTGEALDTMHLLRLGYEPHNLYAVNQEKARLAWLTRTLDKHGAPPVNTVSGDFLDILKEIGPFDVVSFDGTGYLSDTRLDYLSEIAAAAKSAVVTATCFAGREKTLSRVIGGVVDDAGRLRQRVESARTSSNEIARYSHCSRAAAVMAAFAGLATPDDKIGKREWLRRGCLVHVTSGAWHQYINVSGRPLVWVVCRVVPHFELRTLKEATYLGPLGIVPKCWQIAYTEARVPGWKEWALNG